MAAGTINLQCDPETGNILCLAIREYAHAAYPEGASECAQVARYTLLEIAATIESGVRAGRPVIAISKRPRAMLRAAIEYYYDRQDAAQGGTSAAQREVINGMLGGASASCAQLAAAAEIDRAGK